MDFILFLINHIRNFIEIYLGKLDTLVKYDDLESFLQVLKFFQSNLYNFLYA